MEKIWYLKRINIFSNLSKEEMSYIDKNSAMKSYEKRDLIYSPPEFHQNIYFLKKGKVKLYKIDIAGKKMTHTILKEREIFGNLAPVDKDNLNEFAEAIEATLVCVIDKDYFLSFIRNKPTIILKLNKLLGLRVYELEIMIENFVFKALLNRLAFLLIKLINKFGEDEGDYKIINIPLTHYDLATMIGATREATSIALNKLKENGIIDLERKKILIKDFEQLLELSEM